MPVSQFNDLWFSTGGDYLLGPSGDLFGTDQVRSYDEFAGLKQQILHRLICEKAGWEKYPEICAGLEEYIGYTINESVLERIKTKVIRSITSDNLVTENSLVVEAIPLTQASVAVLIWVKTYGEKPIIGFTVDIQTGSRTRIR